MATFTLSRRMSEWKHLSPPGESEECTQRRFVLSECVFNLSLWRTRLNSSRDDSRYLNWRSGASRSRSAADKREPLRLGAARSLLTDLRDDSSPHKHMFRPQVCLCFLMYVFLPFFFERERRQTSSDLFCVCCWKPQRELNDVQIIAPD